MVSPGGHCKDQVLLTVKFHDECRMSYQMTAVAIPSVEGPAVSIDDVAKPEDNIDSTPFEFTVSLSEPATSPITIDYITENGITPAGATASGDYAAVDGDLTFEPGESEKTISVPVTGDLAAEPDEYFRVNLSNPSGGTLAKSSGTGLIQNDDGAPEASVLTIDSPSLDEGNDDVTNATYSTNMAFKVELRTPAPQATVINYRTVDDTAKAGSDYQTPEANTVTIPEGQQSATINVRLRGDTTYGNDETFFLEAWPASPDPAVEFERKRGTGIIQSDDLVPPDVFVSPLSVKEGNSDTTPARFEITQTAVSEADTKVTYETLDNTAKAGSDYNAAKDTATIEAGDLSTTAAVEVKGDRLYEADETFDLKLTDPVDATLQAVGNQATGTIHNDDPPTVTVLNASRTEGSSGTATPMAFTIKLSGPSPVPVTVNYSTVAGTATAGSDYTTVAPTRVTIPAGSLSTTVNVPVVGDKIYETNETFKVKLSSPTGATLASAYQATGTIVNDDPKPSLSVADIKFAEGNSGATNRLFTVKLSTPSGADTKVNYATANSSAIAGSDYTAKTGTLTIRKGATSATVPVSVTGDTVTEKNEIFYLKLSSAVNATISDTTAAATILNDDPPALRVGDVSVTEIDSGYNTATFDVTMSAPTTSNVTVKFATANGTATAADYVAKSGTLTILAGQSSGTVSVSVKGDTLREPNETFFMNLSSPVKATIADGQGRATIVNDD